MSYFDQCGVSDTAKDMSEDIDEHEYPNNIFTKEDVRRILDLPANGFTVTRKDEDIENIIEYESNENLNKLENKMVQQTNITTKGYKEKIGNE